MSEINGPLIGFLVLALSILVAGRYLFSGVLEEMKQQAKVHARYYALAYIKCFALVAIASGACFTETFWGLSKQEAAGYAWWNWAIAFWKPVAAGLATLCAFLDRSGQTATAKKESDEANSKPPFSPPRP